MFGLDSSARDAIGVASQTQVDLSKTGNQDVTSMIALMTPVSGFV